MAYYAVTLKIYLGDYEKHVTTVREADCSENAEYDALCGETHNAPLSFREWCEGVEWWDDYMVYEIYSCRDIPKSVYDVMVNC